jgi:hypothetical protein
MASDVKRPATVTVLVVLVFLGGVAALAAGMLGLFFRGDTSWVYPVIAIVIGLIYLAVASGLSRGSQVARLIVAVVTVLQMINGVWSSVASGNWGSAVFAVVWGVAILWAAYNAKASAFFRS